MVAVLDNRTNPVLCAKHATKDHRKQISRGQRKYTLDVEYKYGKTAKQVELVYDDRDSHEYKILHHIQSKFSFLR